MYKNILVTGGAGFIGSNFIRYLLRGTKDETRETKIINLDKLTYSGNAENLKDVEKDPRYTFVKGDICDEKLLAKLARECDAIINFAAESHVDRSIVAPDAFIRTNIVGTFNLLELARGLKDKILLFHHVSTDEVFGSLGEAGYFTGGNNPQISVGGTSERSGCFKAYPGAFSKGIASSSSGGVEEVWPITRFGCSGWLEAAAY